MNRYLVAFLFCSTQLLQAPHSVEAFVPTLPSHTSSAFLSRSSFLHARTTSETGKKQTFSLNSRMGGLKSRKTETTEVIETSGMPDLISFLRPQGIKEPEEDSAKRVTLASSSSSPLASTSEGLEAFDGDIEDSLSFATVFSIAAVVGGAILFASGNYLGLSAQDVLTTGSAFVHHPQQTMTSLIEDIKDIGPAAPLFFGLLYCVAEILAIPATPLTLSAGYLFGLTNGVGVVLLAGTVAACVGFAIGKTVLRGAVEGLLDENPEFRKLDKAIGKEGFKLLVLVRLTPILPFSISNYIYGASAIKFWPYFWGTLLGFTPGTIAYVYTGMVGQAVLSGEGDQPWYYYAAGLTALAGLLKIITDTASGIVSSMEEDMED